MSEDLLMLAVALDYGLISQAEYARRVGEMLRPGAFTSMVLGDPGVSPCHAAPAPVTK